MELGLNIKEAKERIKSTEKYLEQLHDYLQLMQMAEKVEEAVLRYEEKYGKEEKVKPLNKVTMSQIGEAIKYQTSNFRY